MTHDTALQLHYNNDLKAIDEIILMSSITAVKKHFFFAV